MKQVLLIDDSNVFRDYIKDKLDSRHVSVTIGVGPLDSMSKMRSLIPDLVIIDFNSNQKTLFDLLEQKKIDPNAKDIPVVILAQNIDKKEIARLSTFGIRKIIPKPIKVDQLFAAITETIHVDFDIDTTPCILEARVNDNIIFIEIAQGLNREKISLLKYKIRELVDLYNLVLPKILIMMSDLSLSFVDGPNLELMMDSVMTATEVRNKNIKILTLDAFVSDFITGNKDYADIQIVQDLSKALDSLLKDVDNHTEKPLVISERILTMRGNPALQGDSSLEMRFKSELESLKSTTKEITIAVVDDDVVIRGVLAKTLQSINAKVDQYESGDAFAEIILTKRYDLIFLDIIMPGLNGFEVLSRMKKSDVQTPVIVLSAISQKEAVIKVLQSGVKSYMIKPLKPEAILKKAIEILQASI
jgi:DNA-binding response OmpR family regulator